jgi:hypothetical protein
VAAAVSLTLNNLFGDQFYAIRTQSVVEVCTVGLGVTMLSSDVNTSFSIMNTLGTQDTVSSLYIPYSGVDPLFNGQVLKNYIFDVFEGKFKNPSLDSISIVDSSGNELDINPNGSINVVINESGKVLISEYSEVLGVVSGISVLIGSYTPSADVLLQKVEFSGTNISEYEIRVDGITIDKKRTYFGSSLNGVFDFNCGLEVLSGKLIEIYTTHNRPSLGDFNSRIQILGN